MTHYCIILSGGIFPLNGDDAKNAFIAAAEYFTKKSDTVTLLPKSIMVNTSDSYEVQREGTFCLFAYKMNAFMR